MQVLPVTLLCILHHVHVKHLHVELVLAFATTISLGYSVLAVIPLNMNRWTSTKKYHSISLLLFSLDYWSNTQITANEIERNQRHLEKNFATQNFFFHFGPIVIFTIMGYSLLFLFERIFFLFFVITFADDVAMNCEHNDVIVVVHEDHHDEASQ